MDLDYLKQIVDAAYEEAGRTGGDGPAYGEVLAYVRSHCNGSCDIALARRQVGPDGIVPGSARECAELWEREAARLAGECHGRRYDPDLVQETKRLQAERDRFEREVAVHLDRLQLAHAERDALQAQAAAATAPLQVEIDRLTALINTPGTEEFFVSVRLEAAHQVVRWGVEHDAGKRPEDWITLFMYLLGKAAKAHFDGDRAKLEHHVITVAAVALNWHRHMTGVSMLMRPGVAPMDRPCPPGFLCVHEVQCGKGGK